MTELRRKGYSISLANDESRYAVDEKSLKEAVRAVLQQSDFVTAEISLAVVDNDTMRDLNRRYLNHDWPTDVLSFPLEHDGTHLVGEIVISADTATAVAAELGWEAASEQLLYVIHGMLHLVGFRDDSPRDRREMRAAEDRLLSGFGLAAPRRGKADRTASRPANKRSPAGVRRR